MIIVKIRPELAGKKEAGISNFEQHLVVLSVWGQRSSEAWVQDVSK